MFCKYFHNQITALLTRFVVATLLVVVLGGVVAPLAHAQTSDPGTAVGNFIGNMIITVGASFAKVGGLALDYSVDTLVVGMGALVNGPELKGAIDSLWTVIRDICNLAFIFAFIYVGIRTIIDAGDAGTKRMLAQIIIGAFLINFSLLFTKIIIDFSNLTAIAVKDAMLQPGGTFSVSFTQQLGLNGLYDLKDSQKLADLSKGGGIWFSLLATLFLLVTAFVFVAGAVLLVVRFVALIFIMIFSPILFAATLFPQTSQYASKLWSSLFSYAFFAPVYFLLLLISMRVIEAVKAMTNKATLADAITTGEVSMSGSAIIFILAIIFMVQSLLLAQKLGMAGGDKAVAWGKSLRGYGQRAAGRAAGSVTFGAVGAASRATVGRLGNRLANDESLKNKAATSWSARQALKLSRGAADSSFDARKVGGVGNKLGIGEGSKGGYQTVQKEILEKEKKFAESLGEVGDDDVRVAARKKEFEAAERTRKAETERLRNEMKNPALLPADRAAKQAEIDKHESDAKDAQTEYEKEKQRRILGSTYAKPKPEDKAQLDAQKATIEHMKTSIKTEWDIYTTLSDTDKELRRPSIEATMRALKKEQDDHKELLRQQPDRGYAGVLEKSRIFDAWPIGRLAHQERKAGEEIRKTAEKGLPKKKDD